MIDDAKMEYIDSVIKELKNGVIDRKNNVTDDFTCVALIAIREMFFENKKIDLTGLMFNTHKLEIQFEREFVSFSIDFEFDNFLDIFSSLDIITRSEYNRTGELPGELKHQIEREVRRELSSLIDLDIAEVVKIYNDESLKKLSWDFDSRSWVSAKGWEILPSSPIYNPPLNSYFIPSDYKFSFGYAVSEELDEETDWKNISMSQIVGVASDG